MIPKKVECYRDGEKLGEKTPREWAEELGITKQNVYDSKLQGRLTAGKYRFYDIGKGPNVPKTQTLAEKEAEARAQGKTYGQLQAEETLAQLRKPAEDTQSDETEEDEEMNTEYTKRPVEANTEAVRLREFARMADETTITVFSLDERWLLTAESDSPVFDKLNWEVGSFRADIVDGNPVLRVVVLNGTD